MTDVIYKRLGREWTSTIYLIALHVLAIFGTLYLLVFSSTPIKTWCLAFILYIITGLSITAGYHRLFTHRSYTANKITQFLYLIFAAGAVQNSVMEWSSNHRLHHQYTDTDNDPYNATKGFYYSHIGWIMEKAQTSVNNINDLKRNPLCKLQDKYYLPLAVFMGFILPSCIAALWHDFYGGFIIAGCLRVAVVLNFTELINSAAHKFGTQPYSNKNTAKDNGLVALLTFGEGYHNFHHKFPCDYRNGIKYYQFDPSKWLIFLLAKVGLAKDLKRIAKPWDELPDLNPIIETYSNDLTNTADQP